LWGLAQKYPPKADYRNLLISIASGYRLTPFEPAPQPIIQKSINIRLLTESNLPAAPPCLQLGTVWCEVRQAYLYHLLTTAINSFSFSILIPYFGTGQPSDV